MQELSSHRAFILHTRDYKENQVLMEALVEGQGRISLIAYKGSKKNSARNALLQPFRLIQIQFKKDSGLRKLVQIEADSTPDVPSILLTGKGLFCGFYLNEVICRVCPADAHFQDLYQLYYFSLSQLAQLVETHDSFNQHLQLVLRRFEFQLLNELGYGLDLHHDAATGDEITPDGLYELMADKGFVQSFNPNRAVSGELIKQIYKMLCVSQIDVTRNVAIDSDFKLVLSTSKHILRTCLHRHLGDKPLKSRELFRTK